jgi:hypothetical protein
MNSFKIFEVASSIAGLAGISLVVFFFLFKTIIQSILPDLTKRSRQNIVVLMLFMVWSITIIAMTTWIYSNTTYDGGEQPNIEKPAIVEDLDKISSAEPVTKIALLSTLVGADLMDDLTSLSIKKDEHKFEQENIDLNESCGLKVRNSIWLSFNEDKPYYLNFQEGNIKVVLNKINLETQKAAFVLHLKEDKNTRLYNFNLEQNETYTFEYNNCQYEFAYRGKTSWTTGIQYWFKTRYAAHFSIEPK